MRLMNQNDQTGPINIGNPGEFTILELAKQVLEKTESESQITFHPLPGDDPLQRQPDIALAEKVLDWKPTIALDEGLEKTINYFKEELNSH